MNYKYIIIFILACCVFSPLTMFIMGTTPTLAQSNITEIILDPVKGIVGSDITISGENFAGTSATISWDNKVLAKEVAINNGTFKHIISVPKDTRGNHIISVTDNSNWAGSAAEADFVILPSIKLFPNAIEKSSPFTVSGVGFASSESNIFLTLDGKTFVHNSISADKQGSWNISISFNNIDKGRHVISASSPSTNSTEIGELPLIVIPWAEINPSNGPVGTQVYIYGWGFRHNEDGITITWDGKIIVPNITAEMDGSLIVDGSMRENGDQRYSLYVPKSTQGTHVIGIYGSSFTPKGIYPDHYFKVDPALVIEPNKGKKGAIINVQGTGFIKDEKVKVKYDNSEIKPEIIADDTGTFSFEYVILQSEEKDHSFSAIGDKGSSSEAKFTLEGAEGNITPTILEPVNGQKVSAFNSVGAVYSGAFGYLTGLGRYLKGEEVKTSSDLITTLRWAISGETRNWNYLLQVSSNPNFSTLSLEKNIYSGTEYKITRNDSLSKNIYYWRVRAFSNDGNISQWSEVEQFEIVSMPTNIAIVSWVLLIIIIAAIGFIIFLVRANIKKYHY